MNINGGEWHNAMYISDTTDRWHSREPSNFSLSGDFDDAILAARRDTITRFSTYQALRWSGLVREMKIECSKLRHLYCCARWNKGRQSVGEFSEMAAENGPRAHRNWSPPAFF
jgi:hypothetical protein